MKTTEIKIKELENQKKDINKRLKKLLYEKLKTEKEELKKIDDRINEILSFKLNEYIKKYKYSELVSIGIPVGTLNNFISGKNIKISTLEKYLKLFEENK